MSITEIPLSNDILIGISHQTEIVRHLRHCNITGSNKYRVSGTLFQSV